MEAVGRPRLLVVCALAGCAQLVGIHDYHGDASTGAPSDADSGCLAGLSLNGVCPNDLVAGVYTTCVLVSNGLWCWGMSTPTSAAGAMRPSRDPDANPSVVVLSTAAEPQSGNTEGAGCYLQNGSAMCWGPNDDGELGGAASTAIFPPNVENSNGNLVYLAVGGDHVCAGPNSGPIACTGETDKDEIGSANATCDLVPCDTSPVAIDVTVENLIAAGGAHTCASPLGMYPIACWGDNSSGQLGNSSAGTQSAQVPVMDGASMLGSASALALGTSHSCAIVGTQTYCWGNNASGQLGNDTSITELGSAMLVDTPSAARAFVKIAAGGDTTCAIDTNGGVWCWGSDRRGTAGQPPVGSGSGAFPEMVVAPAPVALGSGTVATEIAVGYEHACALIATGDIYCWGDNSSAELGDGSTDHGEAACGTPDCSYMPVRVNP
jgi:alpha-tubulin suppressor-like RCC1 family protein